MSLAGSNPALSALKANNTNASGHPSGGVLLAICKREPIGISGCLEDRKWLSEPHWWHLMKLETRELV